MARNLLFPLSQTAFCRLLCLRLVGGEPAAGLAALAAAAGQRLFTWGQRSSRSLLEAGVATVTTRAPAPGALLAPRALQVPRP